MAQGFVISSNLRESNTFIRDEAIIDNLYGRAGISADIRLFSGNLQHKSRLRNDPQANGELFAFGSFIPFRTFRITTLGNNRVWSDVGWVANQNGAGPSPEIGDIFTASSDGSSSASGTGGSATELIAIKEFESFFETDGNPPEGWTLRVIPRQGRVAFTQGTEISINGGQSFPYVVVNSDGQTRFQLREKDSTAIWDLDTGSGAGVVDSLQLVRRDPLTVENFRNIYVSPKGSNVTLTDRSDDATLAEIFPDPFGEPVYESDDQSGGIVGYEGGIIDPTNYIAEINEKKRKTILTYQLNDFINAGGIKFDGAVRIVNSPDINGNILNIGIPTPFGSFVIGQNYEVTNIGNSVWGNVGMNTLAIGVESFSLTPTSVTQNKIYKIMDLGHSSLGNQDSTSSVPLGGFQFSADDITNSRIQLTSGSTDHGIQSLDVVTFNRAVHDDGDENTVNVVSDPITGLTSGDQYTVLRVDQNEIALSADSDVSTTETLTPPAAGTYTLTVSNQQDWNTLADTTDVTYSVGDIFEAVTLTDINQISGASVAPAIFTAQAAGNTGTTGTAKALDPNGLYISNPATGEAKRAFTGTDNPWSKEVGSTGNGLELDISARSAFYQDDANNPLPGVNAGVTTLTTPFLKTTSDVAQAGNFKFSRQDQTEWSGSSASFVVGESYTITDLGTNRDWSDLFDPTPYDELLIGKEYQIVSVGSNNWNDAAGTQNLNYQVGDTFTRNGFLNTSGSGGTAYLVPKVGDGFIATSNGAGSSGTGGSAIGEPKLLFTNSAQTTVPDDGLDSFGSNFDVNSFTHKIPVTVNGETYFLLADYDGNLDYADLSEGDVVTILELGSRMWEEIGASRRQTGITFTVNSAISDYLNIGSGGKVEIGSGAGNYKVLTV